MYHSQSSIKVTFMQRISILILLLLIPCVLSSLQGCSSPTEVSQEHREDEIEQGLQAIRHIRESRVLTPQQKQSMIERIQMEVEENTGVRINVD